MNQFIINSLLLFCLLPAYTSAKLDTDVLKSKPNANAVIQDEHAIIIHFAENKAQIAKDTLKIACNSGECALVWRGKTIAQEYSFGKAAELLVSLTPLGCENVFFMSVYEGDGCPVMYKILEFKDPNTYFLSDSFGNCEAYHAIKIEAQQLTFDFLGSPDIGRKKATYNYQTSTHKLIKK